MKFHILFLILISFFLDSCNSQVEREVNTSEESIPKTNLSLIILGTIQDAGSPHIACEKECCTELFTNPQHDRKVVSLGLVDHVNNKTYIFEATPDFSSQVKMLNDFSANGGNAIPNGIFLTHAHIGHYTGLMYLGKEAMNADQATVYAMPRMKTFLEQNGPWSQLVNNNNIDLHELNNKVELILSENLSLTPIQVPHRDEYSETVGFLIKGRSKKVLFIPDIDKWLKWDADILEYIRDVDYAFLDATFYDGQEVKGRDISEIPHPFVIESMELFKSLDQENKSKVHFIHFNHTNPLINDQSIQSQKVLEEGFNIAHFGDVFNL